MNINPLQLISMLNSNSPKDVATRIIQENYGNDPSMNYLLQLGNNNDVNTLQQIARNLLGQQGKNFETEMNSLFSALRR